MVDFEVKISPIEGQTWCSGSGNMTYFDVPSMRRIATMIIDLYREVSCARWARPKCTHDADAYYGLVALHLDSSLVFALTQVDDVPQQTVRRPLLDFS